MRRGVDTGSSIQYGSDRSDRTIRERPWTRQPGPQPQAPPETVTARKGFESLADETRIDSLPVRGHLPPWLQGSLLRTGPAQWEVGGRSMKHWFDGLAMLHRFSFADGEVSYANRFLETRAYRAARDTGRITYSEFATDRSPRSSPATPSPFAGYTPPLCR